MLPNSRVLAVAGAAALAATACLPPVAATPSDDPAPDKAGMEPMMDGTSGMHGQMPGHDTNMPMGGQMDMDDMGGEGMPGRDGMGGMHDRMMADPDMAEMHNEMMAEPDMAEMHDRMMGGN